jgi:hypothetical protein
MSTLKECITKKIVLFLVLLVLTAVLSYAVGFYRGCSKVVGSWEGSYITEDFLSSHCYGERNMWLDDIERDQKK